MVFEGFHLCHRFSDLVSERWFLGVILTPVGDLGATFYDFLRYWKEILLILDDFQGPP